MSYIENMRSRLLMGQAFVILYSLLAAVLGRGTKTFVIIFILFIVMAIVQSRRGKGPLGIGKAKPEEILEGRKLYSEEKIRDIQLKDEKLMEDLQEQSKFSMYTSVSMFVGIAYFFLLWPKIDALYNYFLAHTGNNEVAAHFLAFLIFFEGLFVINQAAMIVALKKAGKMPMINIPQSYTVTDRGIVFGGLIGKSGIRFPLPSDVQVRVNTKRGFVELVREGKRSIMKVRLYSRNPKRLYDVLKKYGAQRSSED